MSWFNRFPKDVAWWVLSRFMSAGVRLFRLKQGPASADEWRAVSFSYSQFGEDLVIIKLLQERGTDSKKGIYVDVGAFHPAFYSNTLLLHKCGWSGVNIEANPTRIKLFQRQRPSDINIHAVVSDTNKKVRYVRYPSEALNEVFEGTTIPEANILGELPTKVDEVSTCTLTDILEKHFAGGADIDFLNIDCEGQDYKVLSGLDWSRWRPRIIAAEAKSREEREQLINFLRERGFEVVASLFITLIFARRSESMQT